MDRYYQLLDTETSTITPLWKGSHVFSLVIVIISGFLTAYTLGKSMEAFGDGCILNASIVFTKNLTCDENSSRRLCVETRFLPGNLTPIDRSATNWGNVNLCYFCQFSPLMGMISGIIWCAFFLICSKGGAGFIADEVYHPWRIIYPAMVFAVVSTTVMLLSTLQLESGIKVFCSQFSSVFNTTSCTYDIDQYTLQFNMEELQINQTTEGKPKEFIIFLKIAISTSYICFFGWMLLLTTLILRVTCTVDFQMIQITISPADEGVLQKDINPDDSGEEETRQLSTPEKESINESIRVSSQSGRKKYLLFARRLKPLNKQKSSGSSSSSSSNLPKSTNIPGFVPKISNFPTTHDNKVKYDDRKVSFALPLAQEGTNPTLTNNSQQKNNMEIASLTHFNDEGVDLSKDIETTSFSAVGFKHGKKPLNEAPKRVTVAPLSSPEIIDEPATLEEVKDERPHEVTDASVQTLPSRVVMNLLNQK